MHTLCIQRSLSCCTYQCITTFSHFYTGNTRRTFYHYLKNAEKKKHIFPPFKKLGIFPFFPYIPVLPFATWIGPVVSGKLISRLFMCVFSLVLYSHCTKENAFNLFQRGTVCRGLLQTAIPTTAHIICVAQTPSFPAPRLYSSKDWLQPCP